MQRLLAIIVDIQKDELDVHDVPIINKFVDVFLEDFPRVLPNQEIEFVIEVALSTTSILKILYCMAPLN